MYFFLFLFWVSGSNWNLSWNTQVVQRKDLPACMPGASYDNIMKQLPRISCLLCTRINDRAFTYIFLKILIHERWAVIPFYKAGSGDSRSNLAELIGLELNISFKIFHLKYFHFSHQNLLTSKKILSHLFGYTLDVLF